MGQQRRQFSPEFKADAVALVRSSGRPIAAIAQELGTGESNLSYWLKKDQESRAAADPGRFELSPRRPGRTCGARRSQKWHTPITRSSSGPYSTSRLMTALALS
jgi:transposase